MRWRRVGSGLKAGCRSGFRLNPADGVLEGILHGLVDYLGHLRGPVYEGVRRAPQRTLGGFVAAHGWSPWIWW